MAKILLDHLTKIYPPNVIAVKDVTMEIPDKKIVAILGPSGAGKSTILRLISGLVQPTSGKIWIEDQDVTNFSPQERDIAMVFQFAVVYKHMSIFDNIAYPLKIKRLAKNEIRKKVFEIADMLGLKELLDKKPSGFPMDIQQRVALARAMVREPKAYLLDEPLTPLDPKARAKLRYEIKKLSRRLGQTFIYVTHDQTEALSLADLIGIIHKGSLIQYDTPEKIYHRPLNTFVGDFIGDPGMNFLHCRLEKKEKQSFVAIIGSQRMDLKYTFDNEIEGKEFLIGIRPENIELFKEEKENCLRGLCINKELLGNRVIFHIKINGDVIKVKCSDVEYPLAMGDEVWVKLSGEQIRIYDENGDLIGK